MAEEHFFYINPKNIDGKAFILDKSESRHLIKVLRRTEGDSLSLLDGVGKAYEAVVGNVQGQRVSGKILKVHNSWGKSSAKVHLGMFLAKGDRMDMILEKTTELGVSLIHPLIMDRCIRRRINLERSTKIVQSAAKQSGRSQFPTVHPTIGLTDWLKISSGKLRFYCHGEGDQSLSKFFAGIKKIELIYFLVGPEGDFSERELKVLRDTQVPSVHLGTRRLRAETAAIAVLSIVNEHIQNRKE